MSGDRPIIVFGTGGVAAVVRYILEHESPYGIAAVTADRDHLDRSDPDHLDVIPFDEIETHFPPSRYGMFVAVGYSRMNAIRAAKCQQARDMGYELVSHVSPRSSTWPNFSVGPNTIVMEGCTIGPDASIGAGCIVWPRCYIGHGATIGDYSWLSANASVAGLSSVGSRCVLGTACVIRDRTRVGDACIIGAGAVLTQDLEPDSVVAAPCPRRLPGTSDRLPDL